MKDGTETSTVIPRRNDFDRQTPAERTITDAMLAVEDAGADARLTRAVQLLAQARDLVGDVVDGEPFREAGVDSDTARLAAIGRAVIWHIMPGDDAALRQATAERVVDRLRRDAADLHSLQTCDALRVGRAALVLRDALGLRPAQENK